MSETNQSIEGQQQSVTEILNTICKLGPEFTHMLWGSPGIGKTEAVKAAFPSPEYEIVLVLAGCSEPTDISGVPFEYKYKDEAVATQILAPIWAWHASVEAPP
jgi:replication-associated recombination protein RarA